MSGFIFIYRRIIDHWIWDDAKQLKRWLELIMLASWQQRVVYYNNQPIVLERGQIAVSQRALMGRWHMSNRTVKKFLNILANAGMITKVKKSKAKCFIITICNYDKYQNLQGLSENLAAFDPGTGVVFDPEIDDFSAPELDKNRADGSRRRSTIEENNNIIIKNQEKTLGELPREQDFLAEVLSQIKLEQGCMSLRITPEQYRDLVAEVVNDWKFNNETDWSYKHLLNTMRVKVQVMNRKKKTESNGNTTKAEPNSQRERTGGTDEDNPLRRARVRTSRPKNQH